MADFTGITADHAETILGQSVVSGEINESGHLILTRGNGSTIDAGDFTGIVTDVLDAQVAEAIDTNLPDAVAGTVVDLGDISGAQSFTEELNSDTAVNALVKARFTGNVTLSLASMPSSPKPNTQFAFRILQDATGGRTLTLTGFKKSQGVLTLTTTPGAIDIVVFMWDGGNWYAGLMGVDFK